MKFLRNAWYVAGFGNALVAGQLVARTLLDEPVVMFRNREGLARAKEQAA